MAASPAIYAAARRAAGAKRLPPRDVKAKPLQPPVHKGPWWQGLQQKNTRA